MAEQDADEDEQEGLLGSTSRRFGATWQDITGRASTRGVKRNREAEDQEE